jgi:4'-phosphopantetheinyl transferase EntD
VIEEILPSSVRCAEAFDDTAPAPLFPAEEAFLTRARDKRRREFATARACARRALGALGVTAGPLVPGPRGAPDWPAGVVGSLTHCDGYRGAAVGRAEHVVTLGIDAEPARPLPEGVLGLVTSPDERAELAALAERVPDVCWDRLLFSAKETVYKAWFPVHRTWLGFRDAVVHPHPDGTFTAVIRPPDTAEVHHKTGRWLCRDGLLVTAIAEPAPAPVPTPATAPG